MPLAPAVIVIQSAFVTACQLQPGEVVTVTLLAPPAEVNVSA
jgi:hypothetical protein